MIKQTIIVRTDLKMRKGKIAAQVAHASVTAYINAQKEAPKTAEEWVKSGMAKIVLKVENEKQLIEMFQKTKNRFPTAMITDAGKTQIAPGTKTCIAIGPAEEQEIDFFTKNLKLL